MHLDCRQFPKDKLLADIISEKLGMYVRVALFTTQGKHRVFRMILDPEIHKIRYVN